MFDISPLQMMLTADALLSLLAVSLFHLSQLNPQQLQIVQCHLVARLLHSQSCL